MTNLKGLILCLFSITVVASIGHAQISCRLAMKGSVPVADRVEGTNQLIDAVLERILDRGAAGSRGLRYEDLNQLLAFFRQALANDRGDLIGYTDQVHASLKSIVEELEMGFRSNKIVYNTGSYLNGVPLVARVNISSADSVFITSQQDLSAQIIFLGRIRNSLDKRNSGLKYPTAGKEIL